ncbi:MAG: hypothetical protein M1840_004535 [Geoglossum simile]|nr:MAG: hypothetical protein M1840_004535 [Geoglossum simile]
MPSVFERKKSTIIARLQVPDVQYSDLSPKGTVDVGIRPLVYNINGREGLVTTSSCAGRVSVFLEGRRKGDSSVTEGSPPNETAIRDPSKRGRLASVGGKGLGGRWLYVSHDPIPLPPEGAGDTSGFTSLFGLSTQDPGIPHSDDTRYAHFKFEPMILHILTASLEHAQYVLSAALHAGFRESGAINITSNSDGETTPMVAVRSTGLVFDSVVGYLHDSTDCTPTPLIFSSVGEPYLRSLVAIANMRFQENTRRIERFAEALGTVHQPGILLKPDDREWEDGDIRRERKRAEGLEKKQAMQEQRQRGRLINGPVPEDEVPVHPNRHGVGCVGEDRKVLEMGMELLTKGFVVCQALRLRQLPYWVLNTSLDPLYLLTEAVFFSRGLVSVREEAKPSEYEADNHQGYQIAMAAISELNRKHFDEHASSYDNKPWQRLLFDHLTQEIRARKDWIGVHWAEDPSDDEDSEGKDPKRCPIDRTTSVRLLDYAAGTGMISRAFAPLVTELRGIDISPNMVKEYNTRATNQGLAPQEMSATVGNLLALTPTTSLASPEFFGFDIAVVGLGFHHFADPALAAKRLVERLTPRTGILLVIDFMAHAPIPHGEGSSHGGHHHQGHDELHGVPHGVSHDALHGTGNTVVHHGFEEGKIREIFMGAGCVDVDVVVLGKGITLGEGETKYERSVFMARGRRAR